MRCSKYLHTLLVNASRRRHALLLCTTVYLLADAVDGFYLALIWQFGRIYANQTKAIERNLRI